MKLIIAGASGFVGSEVIRQGLKNPKITSIIALARRPVSIPPNLDPAADSSKFRSVTIKDYDSYSDEAKQQFAGADACIWTVAITPTKSKALDFEVVHRVCQEYTLIGLKTMLEARGAGKSTPFRFIYMSGAATERDQTKTPGFMPQYSLMRGETETRVLAYAAEHKGSLEACVVKPGIIIASGEYMKYVFATGLKLVGMVSNIALGEVSAAMLQLITHGWDKEPVENDELIQMGRAALKDATSSSS